MKRLMIAVGLVIFIAISKAMAGFNFSEYDYNQVGSQFSVQPSSMQWTAFPSTNTLDRSRVGIMMHVPPRNQLDVYVTFTTAPVIAYSSGSAVSYPLLNVTTATGFGYQPENQSYTFKINSEIYMWVSSTGSPNLETIWGQEFRKK